MELKRTKIEKIVKIEGEEYNAKMTLLRTEPLYFKVRHSVINHNFLMTRGLRYSFSIKRKDDEIFYAAEGVIPFNEGGEINVLDAFKRECENYKRELDEYNYNKRSLSEAIVSVKAWDGIIE